MAAMNSAGGARMLGRRRNDYSSNCKGVFECALQSYTSEGYSSRLHRAHAITAQRRRFAGSML
ncbi:hypothetical protein BDR07DRAFT_1443232, partial [Suillus spraguei]